MPDPERKPGRPKGSRNRVTLRRAGTVKALEREGVIGVRKAFANLARIAEGSDAAAVTANRVILDRLLGPVKVDVAIESTHYDVAEIFQQIKEERRQKQLAESTVITAEIAPEG